MVQREVKIKIVHNTYYACMGKVEEWGVIINDAPRCTFHSKEQLNIFLDALKCKEMESKRELEVRHG